MFRRVATLLVYLLRRASSNESLRKLEETLRLKWMIRLFCGLIYVTLLEEIDVSFTPSTEEASMGLRQQFPIYINNFQSDPQDERREPSEAKYKKKEGK